MARKRANNEGSVYKIPSGRWCAQVSLEGKRLSKVFDTQKECLEWIHKVRGQIDDWMTYTSTKVQLGEFLKDWLLTIKFSKRPTTTAHYETLIRLHIVSYIGQIKVADLRAEQIQRLYTHLITQKIGTNTIRKVHIVLHSALQQAVRLGIINRNPADIAHPPKEPTKEMKILDESQISQLMISLRGHRWEALYQLAVVTGMRQMELLGLRWADLDWIRQTLKVERQLDRSHGNGIQFSAPKTRYGKRTIALGVRTVAILRAHAERQQVVRINAAEKWQEHDLIFTTSLGGPINPSNLLKEFKKLLQEVGLPSIRFHDLRHTAASLMLNHNIPPIVVSRQLGHARASITLDIYGHLVPGMAAEVAEIVDEYVVPVAVELKQAE